MNPTQLREHIVNLMQRCRSASFSTIDEHGRPHAADLWFAFGPDLRLYFVSSPRSAHITHLAHQPYVAMTMHVPVEEPQLIQGLQMHGRCFRLENERDMDSAMKLYQDRYPFVLREPYAQALKVQALYAVTPTWVRWIDNARGFGFKAELRLDG